MVDRLVFFVAFLVATCALLAQGDSTVYLSEITHRSDAYERFTTGSGLISLELHEPEQLDQALARQAGIYMKSYGSGQLATIAFRGTSANHTNVLWHGIPAIYPTLGLMDFSQWPAWLMESLAINQGGGSALYGTGAIGGTVLVDSRPEFVRPGNQSTFNINLGSFGYHFLGAKSSYGKRNWHLETRIFRSFLENDFEYEWNNKTVQQPNASVINYGIQQKVEWWIKSNQKLFIDAQYTTNDREIQPSKLSPNLDDQLTTGNFRMATGYLLERQNSGMNATLAFLRNDQLFNEAERTISDQYSAQFSYYGEVIKGVEYRLGNLTSLFKATSENFASEFTDWQMDVYGSLKFQLFQPLTTTINLRQAFYEETQQFVPSINHSIRLWKNRSNQLIFEQGVSRNFRFPTLNDLHWNPGGNPDLRPERSWSAEGTLRWRLGNEVTHLEIAQTHYRTWAQDWIVWLPGEASIWSPENFRNVSIMGWETSVAWDVSIGQVIQEMTFNYSHTRSTNETGNLSGKQLPYTPEHLGNLVLSSHLPNGLTFNVSGQYTGRRYTTLDNTLFQSVDSFFLTNATVRKQFDWSPMQINLTIAAKNLFDVNFENLQNRAMPGINYELQLSVSIK